MQPEIDAQLSNFFEETTPREFARVMRGYDPHQVDEYFKQLDGEVRQHREQVQALQQELSDAHRQIREQERPTYAGLGSRIEQLLRLAEEQATEIAQEARSAANELNAAAKVDAAEVRAAAENEAAELRANAKRETDEQRGSAEREADAIKTGARREADELTSTTEREVAKLRATADHEVAEKRAAIERDIAKLRTTTEREVAQLKASAKRERDEILTTSKRQADEMRSQAQRILEESEAQRAQAEAEFEIQLASRREEAERQEAERLAAAQSATQKLVTEAEQRAATAEQRAAKASAQAEQTRREADQHSRQLVTNAKKNADQIVAQAKAQADQLLADTKSEIERHRASAQREVDDLSKQKESISSHLAQISQLLGTQMPRPGRRAQAGRRGSRPARRGRQRPAEGGGPAQAAPTQAAPARAARQRARRQAPRPPSARQAPPAARAQTQQVAGQAAGPGQGQGQRRGVVDRVSTAQADGGRRVRAGPRRGSACQRSGHRGLAAVERRAPGRSCTRRRRWPGRRPDRPSPRAGPSAASAPWPPWPGPAVSSSHRLRLSSVAVQPGHSALTRTPSAAHSTASDLVSEISPALAAPYGDRNGAAAHPGHRGHVDHRAGAPLHQVPADRVADVHGRVEVQPEQLVPAGQPQVQERHHEVGPARVVHHDVQVAELVDRGRRPRRPPTSCSVTSAGMTNAFRPSALICCRGVGQPVLAAGHQRQVGARAGQRDRDHLADPPGRAGDESLLAGQVEERHGQSFHSVGSGQAAGLTRRTISFSTIRT